MGCCLTGVNESENKAPINNAINANQYKVQVNGKELSQDEKDLISKLKIGICKVTSKKGNSSSMGILCKQPFPDKIRSFPALIVNVDVFKENMLKEGGGILLQGNNGFSKTLNLKLIR